MRNPKRIQPFLEEIGKIWEEKCPDWRFGQLLFNVLGGRDPFYYEEDKFLAMVKNYFNVGGYERTPEESKDED